jgi:hypothetical protein
MWIAPQAWQLDAVKRETPAGMASFVDRFVHDAKVGFLSNAEPFSYFSQRGVTESTRSVSGWFESNVARPVDKAVESATDYVGEKVDQGQKAAREAAEAAAQQARHSTAYAAEQAQRAQAAAARAARSVGDAVGNATKQALDGLSEAWQKFAW